MNEDSSGSCRTTASASRRMRVQTGSTFASTSTVRVCCLFMTGLPSHTGRIAGEGLAQIGAGQDPRNRSDSSKNVVNPSQALKEFEDRRRELVVLVARHHVARARDVGE